MKKSDVKTFLVYIKKVFLTLLDFIWPQFCLGCNKEGTLCCTKCKNSLELLPLDHSTNCHICLNYGNPLVQKLIKTFKYKYIENISDILVDFLYQQALKLNLPSNTVVTNIPLHKSKKRERGFDQTELLAKKLAEKLNLQYSPLLKRTRKTKTQADLSKEDRRKNVKDIFRLNKKISNPILLIDDVVTTGSTLNEASKLLNKVTCLVIAKN